MGTLSGQRGSARGWLVAGIALVTFGPARITDAQLGAPPPRTHSPVDTDLDERDINLGRPEPEPATVTGLIRELSDPRFDRREAASQALAELCPGAFRLMARAYRENPDYEMRLRIEAIVRERYLWHTLLKHKGFLGVSYPPNRLDKLPDGSSGVRISGVSPGTAAAAAGLRQGDVIRAIDGQAFTGGADDTTFRDLIQAKGAGGKALLEIYRRGRILTVEVTLRARPIPQYIGPDLLEELNSRMQAFALWWGRHFALPAPSPRRTSATAVLDIPE
jgi:hypothetical protein